MKVKRIFSVFIIAAMILTTVIPALAAESVIVEEAVSVGTVIGGTVNSEVSETEAKVAKDEAVELAKKKLKELFSTEIDEKKFDTRIEFRQDYETREEYVWAINWDMNDNEKSIHIDIWISGNTGEALRVSKREYNHNETTPAIASITEKEAETLAENFIKKANLDKFKETRIMENRYPSGYGSTYYNFRYNRIINDIEYDRNYITVEVDGIKGKVVSYSYRWDEDVETPSKDRIIDAEKAQEIIKENINMSLRYIPHRDKYGNYSEKVKEVKLIYSPEYLNGSMVDAKEGTIIDYMGRDLEEEKVKDISNEIKEEIYIKAKDIKKLDKEIDQTRATELIKDYLDKIYGEDYELDNIRYVENEDYWETNGEKAWTATFYKQSNGYINRENRGNITIDALTEKLISVYKYNYEEHVEEFDPAITWEEGYDKVIEAIEKYFPEKIKDINTKAKYRRYTHIINGKEMPEMEYYFNLPRIVNGIDYSNDSINITVDTRTGEIRELRCRWSSDVNFQSPEGAIGKEAAEKVYFEEYKPELVYTKINKGSDTNKPEWETKLVYRLMPTNYISGNIDAFTGKFLNHSGEEISTSNEEFEKKVKGHWAEKELRILASQGIIDLKEIDLDKEITKLEAIKMLVDAKGYKPYMVSQAEALKFSNIAKDSEEYTHFQLAVQYGIIENQSSAFPKDEKLTREELTVLLVNLLGHDELAKITEIFRLPFEDAEEISKDKIGYVAICKGLNIIGSTDNKFRPTANVNMAEMASAIYKALGNIRR